jgi:hypothetical protein
LQEADRGHKSLKIAGGRQRTEKPENCRRQAEDIKPEDCRMLAKDRKA